MIGVEGRHAVNLTEVQLCHPHFIVIPSKTGIVLILSQSEVRHVCRCLLVGGSVVLALASTSLP